MTPEYENRQMLFKKMGSEMTPSLISLGGLLLGSWLRVVVQGRYGCIHNQGNIELEIYFLAKTTICTPLCPSLGALKFVSYHEHFKDYAMHNTQVCGYLHCLASSSILHINLHIKEEGKVSVTLTVYLK